MPVPNVPATPRPPLPSTTLMLLRRGRSGLEVLMLRRILRSAFGGAWVFPGGVLDGQDRDPRLYRRCLGLGDDRASRLLALRRNGLAYWVAAIRETFEEAGLLMAVNGCGQSRRAGVRERKALMEGRVGFAELCRRGNWKLPAGRLRYVSHWITPSAAPRRFSTRFFVAETSFGLQAKADGREVLRARWFEPDDALRQDIPLAHPTRHFLRILRGMGSVEHAMEWAAAAGCRPVPATLPEVRRINGKLMSCLPTGEVLGPFNMKHYPMASGNVRPGAGANLPASASSAAAANSAGSR